MYKLQHYIVTTVYTLMDNKSIIPIFPLNILPLPGELVPLHIFEQRYRDLLVDLERDEIEFGIFYVADENTERMGSIVKLQKVMKRYETGESDIVVQCTGTFIMCKYLKSFQDRLYAGGEVMILDSIGETSANLKLKEDYSEYQTLLGREPLAQDISLDSIANSIDLDSSDRLKYLTILEIPKKQNFLDSRLTYKKYIVDQEFKYKHSYTLN